MIRNQWYVVLDSREVRPGRLTGVTRLNERLVFWRDSQGKVVCFSERCPHLGARLSQGKLQSNSLACPFHGFEFDPSGRCCYLPALGRGAAIPKNMRVNAYRTYEAHGLIWIYWGEPLAGVEPPRFFDSITDPFSYSRFQMHWPVHYSRVIENQLDVMHLPFIHGNSIGRGGRMVVDGPQVTIEDDLLNLWVYNRLDDGTPARRADDLPAPQRHPFLQFRFPNLWQNWIADDARILVAFVPVDEENTIMYGRFYQRYARLPVLREVVNLIGKWSSIYIAGQDLRIVSYQSPKKSSYRNSSDKPVQGDHAILAYRRHRADLKLAAGQTEA